MAILYLLATYNTMTRIEIEMQRKDDYVSKWNREGEKEGEKESDGERMSEIWIGRECEWVK